MPAPGAAGGWARLLSPVSGRPGPFVPAFMVRAPNYRPIHPKRGRFMSPGRNRPHGRAAVRPPFAFSRPCRLFSLRLPILFLLRLRLCARFSVSINGSLSTLPLCLSHSRSVLRVFLCSFPVSGCLLASSLDTHVPDSGPGAPSPVQDQMRVSHINFSEKGSPAAWRRDPTLVTAATRQSGDNKSPERTPPPAPQLRKVKAALAPTPVSRSR